MLSALRSRRIVYASRKDLLSAGLFFLSISAILLTEVSELPEGRQMGEDTRPHPA